MTQFQSENIQFPCRWHGSLVVKADTQGTEDAVRQAFQALNLTDSHITHGNVSSAGTYITWKLSCMVPDLLTLRALFTALEGLPGVRMLI